MEGTRVREPIPGALQRALDGRYVLERRLGRGGMGVVSLAREPRLARRVAIKVLPPERALQPAARERFLREARTAAGLSHPNIVPIFAVDEVDDVVFFVMAYVEGESLGQRVRARGPLAPDAVARLLQDVARALAYAHAHGVVHRDVKPDNILLEAPTGRVLVSDSGIARVGSGSGTTGPREIVGTAEFMSPEQASGGVVDPRSDLYSLGVVAYYALSGRVPFEDTDPYVLLARHATEPAPPLASVAPAVPRQLARMVDRCLAKEPSARFAGGSELAEAIDDAALLQAAPPIAGRAFLYGNGPSRFERTMRRLSYTALGAAAAGVGLHLLEPALLSDASLFALFGVSALAALLAAIVARARTEHRTDPKAERRLRFWRGPLGRWLCRVAALGLRPDRAAAPELAAAPDPAFAVARPHPAVPPVTAPYRRLGDSVAPPPP